MATINQLAEVIIDISGKKLSIKHVSGPQGVRGRNSDNRLIREKLGWALSMPFKKGLDITHAWIEEQVEKDKRILISNRKG